jgi:putative hemolysin
MNIPVQLGIIGILILINAFFAAAEIALVSVNSTRIKNLAEQGNKRAQLVEESTRDSTRFLATIQIGLTLASFFTSATAASELSLPAIAFFTPLLGPLAKPLSLIVVTVAIAILSLILGELVPKRLGLRHSEAISLFSIQPIRWLGQFTSPLVKFLSSTTNLILRLLGNPPGADTAVVSVEEIKALVDAARMGGAVGEQERRIIYGAVELGHINARAIMVPRVQIQALKTTTSIEEAYEIVSQNAHTRLPVCEGDLDNIVGILHVKDLIRPLPDLMNAPPTVRELVRPVRHVPEGKPVADLLREMQQNRLHLVIIKDEFGGTAGLVTLEDVLEEIVGEIRDEYDAEEEQEFRRLAQHSGVFKIRASIGTVNNELDVHLPRDEVATLAGLFLEELQRSPEPGDQLQIDQINLTVLRDGQRVRVTLIDSPSATDVWSSS